MEKNGFFLLGNFCRRELYTLKHILLHHIYFHFIPLLRYLLRRMTVDSELRRQDAVLQFVDSSQAERLVLYHNDAEIAHRIFPNGGAEEFIQLPKYIMGGRHSFDFVLLRCLCLAPLGFKSWLDSSFLKHVITRVFFLREQVATSKEVRILICFLPHS